MARAPSRVTRTVGQGVSRRAYQASYALGQHGTGSVSGTGLKFSTEHTTPNRGREYAKRKVDPPHKFTVSYGDTIEPTDLADINRMYPKRSK